MLIRGTFRIEGGTGREVFVVDESRKNREVCRVQFTTNGLPKLVLFKPTVSNKGNYNALPYNYRWSFQSMQSAPVFQAEVRVLTRSEKCFTPEELKEQRKANWKEEVDLTKEVNNPVTKDETNEFLKLMKHSEYSVVEQLKKTPARISL